MEKRCLYCDAPLPAEARFCPHCGKSLISRKRVHPPRFRLRKWLIGCGVLLCLGAIVLCFREHPAGPGIGEALALDEAALPETAPPETAPPETAPPATAPSRRKTPRIEKTHQKYNGVEMEFTLVNFLPRRTVEKSPNGFTMDTLSRKDGTRTSCYTVFDNGGFDYYEYYPNGRASTCIQYRVGTPVEIRTFDDSGTETQKDRITMEDPFSWIAQRRQTLNQLLEEESSQNSSN